MRVAPIALRSPLLLLVSLALIRGLLYLSIFPPFLAPDEAAHFEAVRLIGQEQKWPVAEAYATTPMHPAMEATFDNFRLWTLVGLYSPTRHLGVTDNLFASYYPTQIAGSIVLADSYLLLYHAGLAPFSSLISSFDLVTQVYVLRLISVILAALTVVIAWFTLRAAFPDRLLFAMGATAFIVFWPMHTHTTASINADGLAEFLASCFILMVILTWSQGLSLFRGVLLTALLIGAVLTKPTTFFLLPFVAAVAILYVGRKLNWRNRTRVLCIGLLILTVWILSFFLYGLTGGGRQLLSLFSNEIRIPDWQAYVTPSALRYYVISLNYALVSFAGIFGWSNIHVPWSWIWVWAVLFMLVVIGILIFLARNLGGLGRARDHFSARQKEIIVIFLLALIFSLMGVTMPVIMTQSRSWGIHARYYFPAIIPLAFFLFMGVRELVPVRFSRFLWPGWLSAWVLYDAVILIFILLPVIYS